MGFARLWRVTLRPDALSTSLNSSIECGHAFGPPSLPKFSAMPDEAPPPDLRPAASPDLPPEFRVVMIVQVTSIAISLRRKRRS